MRLTALPPVMVNAGSIPATGAHRDEKTQQREGAMRTKQARNELGQQVTLYWCERCAGWHDLNEDPEPVR